MITKYFFTTAVCGIAAAAFVTVPANAQAQSEAAANPGNDPFISQLERCRILPKDSDRLTCFDEEVSALISAANAGEVKIVQAQDITKARQRLFGFSLPKIGLFGSGDEEEFTTLESTITKVRQLANNEWAISIEEGDAVWQMKSTVIHTKAPAVGDPVEFKPAAMGTYWIRVAGRKGIRGSRIR